MNEIERFRRLMEFEHSEAIVSNDEQHMVVVLSDTHDSKELKRAGRIATTELVGGGSGDE